MCGGGGTEIRRARDKVYDQRMQVKVPTAAGMLYCCMVQDTTKPFHGLIVFCRVEFIVIFNGGGLAATGRLASLWCV